MQKNRKSIRSWADLTALMEKLRSSEWIFRGQPRRWNLIPKIGRERARVDPLGKPLPHSVLNEKRMLREFKRQARPYFRDAPGQRHDIEWLAIAQHYGMPTRLLDWTESLLIAAYFAVEGAGTLDKTRPDIAWTM